MRYILAILLMFWGVSFAHAQNRDTCENEPTIEFDEEPIPDSLNTMETVVVNGKKWTHRYLKSRAAGITVYDVLPDCSVLIVGRKGIAFYINIDDAEWKNPVYNSSFYKVSKDGKKIFHLDKNGRVVLNDVVQPLFKGFPERAGFDDDGNVIIIWDVDGKKVETVNGVVKK